MASCINARAAILCPMLTLDQYLAANGESDAAFADRCDCDPSTIWRIRTGKITPSLDLARRIVQATRGELRFEDLIANG